MGTPAALVTGASGGIGRALARHLASQGFDLTLTGRRVEALETYSAELRAKYGVSALVVGADLADEHQVSEVGLRHAGRYDRLDALVLCAGVGTVGDVEGYSLSRLDKQFAVNLRAPFQLASELLPLLRKTAQRQPARGAKIVAIASIVGMASERSLAAYGASKAALISFCETVNLEASPDGVTATALSPGFVDTEMAAWVRDQVPPTSMISVGDITEIFAAILRLSPAAVIPNIVIGRAGTNLWRA